MISLYQQRRVDLLNRLPKNSFVILAGYQQKVRSKNIKYHFRQDNDFLYLTGFSEPDALALLYIDPDKHHQFVLFCRPRDAAQEVSFGARAGKEGAVTQFGATQAYAVEEFEAQLLYHMNGKQHIYLSDELGRLSSSMLSLINQQRMNCPFDTVKQFRTLTPLAQILHPMRVIKSTDEIALIKAAVAASIDGHKAVMKACQPGVNEAELAAIFDFAIAKHGCQDVAYPNIVASGNNACCLHYEENCCETLAGQMLLIDAGAEYRHYASDITRTYPVNGQFSAPQKALYQVVLTALDNAISRVKPGAAWNTIYETCMHSLAQGLLKLGLLAGSLDEVLASESYKRFTVHKTGHWLGMDVHDVGPYHDDGQWRVLEPNMVFTIEPGIYIPMTATDVPEQYRGIGIRIEDDILVTATGCENLSAAVPRTVTDIEAIMAT